MEPSELKWQEYFILRRHGVYKNFKVVEWNGEEFEVFKDELTNRFWICPGDYWSAESLVEVYPQEITKIVYLPKELI